jgi:hypothetical protein
MVPALAVAQSSVVSPSGSASSPHTSWPSCPRHADFGYGSLVFRHRAALIDFVRRIPGTYSGLPQFPSLTPRTKNVL